MPRPSPGYLFIAAEYASAFGTLVDRTTCFTMLLHLHNRHGA